MVQTEEMSSGRVGAGPVSRPLLSFPVKITLLANEVSVVFSI